MFQIRFCQRALKAIVANHHFPRGWLTTPTVATIRYFGVKSRKIDEKTLAAALPTQNSGLQDDIDEDEHATSDTTDKLPPKRIMPDIKALEMLRIYKEVNNNLHIFPSFVVPAEDPWPDEFHGYQLGKKVTLLRRQKKLLWDFYVYRLDKLDFIWKPKDYRLEKVIKAIHIYKELFGNVNVPQTFVVPSDNLQWPKLLWGYNFGKVVHHIRCAGVYSDRKDYFEGLGISYDIRPTRLPDFDGIKKSLEVYFKKYGNFEVPYGYVIPPNDFEYPKSMRGAQLGIAMCQIIHRDYYQERHKELIEMGVSLEPRFELRFQRIYEAIKCFRNLYGNKRISQRYVVPEGSEHFPSYLWGMKLGRKLTNIRLRGDFKEFHYLLRELNIPTKDDAKNTS